MPQTAKQFKGLGCIIYLRITSTLIVTNILGPSVIPTCAPPSPPARLATPLAAASTCQQYHPRSSVLSRRAGGWLAHHSAIINFPEWQTLDVWRAVLSHPLLGVPQPPSLLPVNLGFLHLPSRAGIRSFRTLDAQSRVNDRTP